MELNRVEKEKFIKDNYSKCTNKELADMLGYKNEDTLRTIACKLGITKNYIVEDLVGEEWREHSQYPSYLISNKGRIKSKIRNKLIATRVHENYIDCSIKNSDGIKKNPRIHRLVAEAFIDNPMNFPVVNHKDGNKLNNDVSNLEWTDYAGNTQHAIKEGLFGYRKDTLTENEVHRICSLLEKGYSIKETMSEDTRFTRSRVEKIRQRNRWLHISKDYNW